MELLGAHYGLGAGIHDVVVVDSPVSRVAAAWVVDDVLMKVLQQLHAQEYVTPGSNCT